MTLTIGKKAPDFTLLNDEDVSFSLSSQKGKKVVLYFYPKDNTPGCTKEACAFQEELPHFSSHDAVIVGVSRDSVQSHRRFKEKFGLEFSLLADTEEVVCKAYDVLKEKNMYGKKRIGIERSTFLIDEVGIVRQIWRKVKVADHDKAVKEALAAL